MVRSLVFGGNVSESLASYDHESSCWRTSQLSLFEEEEKWLDRLPALGMTRNGKLYQLGCSVRLISANDGSWSGMLPTPTTDQRPQRYKQGGRSTWCAILEDGVMLPTPTAKANQTAPTMRKHWKGILPTPTVNEAKNNPSTPSQWDRNDSLNVEAAKSIGHTKETIGNDMRLNPQFVEWMMGFPTGWTDLEL